MGEAEHLLPYLLDCQREGKSPNVGDSLWRLSSFEKLNGGFPE